ncbi:MAG: hypothetical protein Q9227_003322 [Pyrenula ochraceoflavens]
MAANVVVVHPSARTQRITVTPQTHLNDVLEEACRRFKLDPASYTLKYFCRPITVPQVLISHRRDNKPVELSQPFRLSGLSSGAKLNLTQASRSPSVVSVALQLPEKRLTDKFASNTSVWQILRRFEEGVAGQNQSVRENITNRGVPVTSEGPSGTGRLYYEQPVVRIMGRTLASFTDLQKTLGQLGLTSGSISMNMSYQKTDVPMEVAVAQHQEYFRSLDSDQPSANTSAVERQQSGIEGSNGAQPNQGLEEKNAGAANTPESLGVTGDIHEHPGPQVQLPELQDPNDTSANTNIQTPQNQETPSIEAPTLSPSPSTAMDIDSSDQPTSPISSNSRPFEVFTAASSTTPQAARTSHNPADYVPTIEHAQQHQKHLEASSRPRRLPTDAEIEAEKKAAAEALEKIQEVRISIRFPSQDRLEARFGQEDSGRSLYSFVQEHLEAQLRSEPFLLKYTGDKGRQTDVPNNESKKLIRDLGFKGGVLVTFAWDDMKASLEARATKEVLREESRSKAKDLKVQDMPSGPGENETGRKVDVGSKQKENATEGGEKKKVLPKWLQKTLKK